ncbi:hypothetical protein KQI84_06200 [bacterium]|nr:hypothetical protein [bacterium]
MGQACWLLLAALLFSSLLPSLVHAQQALGEQDRFARAREIDATKEQIRRLFAEGRYEDVIKFSDQLLTLDPDNPQAVFWKDLAERKLLSSDQPSSIFGDGPSEVVPEPTQAPMKTAQQLLNEARMAGGNTLQTPAQQAESRPRSTYRSKSTLPMGVIIGLIVGVIVLLAIAIIAWVMFRNSRRRLQTALEQVRRTRNLDGDATVHDAPTGLADQPTHVTAGGDVETSITQHGVGQPDEPTVSEQTDIMSSLSVGPDEESVFEAGGGVGFPDVPTLHDEFDPEEEQPVEEQPVEEPTVDLASGDSQVGDVEEVKGDTFASVSASDEDDSISLGGESEAPAEEEAEDPNAMSYNSLMFTEDETVMPGATPAAKQEQPEPDAEDTSSLSYNSLMFADDETKLPQAPPPEKSEAEAGPEDTSSLSYNSLMFAEDETKMPTADQPTQHHDAGGEDPNAMSYNSLMFPGDETQMPGAEQSQAKEADDLSKSSFDKEYQNVMFGEGSEETKNLEKGGGGVDEALFDTIKIDGDIKLDDVSLDETLAQDGGSISGEEVTMQLPGTGGDSDPAKMFVTQKNAGKQALEKGNFSRAVECLSVAASLRPDDKEVTQMLDEAKRRRNA